MRLIESLTAAAAVLAAQAADRLDAWVEHNTDTEAPRETPLGFTVPTGERGNGVDVKGLAGEQRARWLAEVKARVDASTGGPWCTEERDHPTGRIISPYGVIATGVTREADRDLIEDARADLFGLLALAEYDDQIIEALQHAARHQTERRNVAERELTGMHEREAAVERVLDSLVDGRLKLTEYTDPETPAGRVRDLVTTLLTQVREAEARADLAERKLDAHHRHDAATDADTVRARAAERIRAYAAEEQARVNDTYGAAYLNGLETAAALIVDEATEADPNAVINSNGDRIIMYGGGGAGDNPPAHILVTASGYVRDVIEADNEAPANLVTSALERHGIIDDRHVGAQVKRPNPLDDIDGGTDER